MAATDAFLVRALPLGAPAHGVLEGDLVLVHPSARARDGDLVVALQPGAMRVAAVRLALPGAQPGTRSSLTVGFAVRDAAGKPAYRPTCNYAYHPADDAVLSLHEMFGQAGKMQDSWKILDEHEIVDGIDELGVLLYGHGKNAYWYGSQLSIEEARKLAPYQSATGLQVTSAVLTGMVWAIENPMAGIVETDKGVRLVWGEYAASGAKRSDVVSAIPVTVMRRTPRPTISSTTRAPWSSAGPRR